MAGTGRWEAIEAWCAVAWTDYRARVQRVTGDTSEAVTCDHHHRHQTEADRCAVSLADTLNSEDGSS